MMGPGASTGPGDPGGGKGGKGGKGGPPPGMMSPISESSEPPKVEAPSRELPKGWSGKEEGVERVHSEDSSYKSSDSGTSTSSKTEDKASEGGATGKIAADVDKEGVKKEGALNSKEKTSLDDFKACTNSNQYYSLAPKHQF